MLDQKGWGALSVTPDQTVLEAIEKMAKEGVGALVVVVGEALAGVFSERDYARKVILEGRSSRDALVRDIMTADVITVTPDETVDQCMHLMTEHRIRHLPVMVGTRVAAMISQGDLVKWIISRQSETIAHLQHYISGGYLR
ncbi:MAG: CBS domain-containing protein [Bryobacteraceae bacterium]